MGWRKKESSCYIAGRGRDQGKGAVKDKARKLANTVISQAFLGEMYIDMRSGSQELAQLGSSRIRYPMIAIASSRRATV